MVGSRRFKPAACSGVNGALRGIGGMLVTSVFTLSGFRWNGKRLFEILKKIFKRLESNREPDQTIGESSGFCLPDAFHGGGIAGRVASVSKLID